MNFQDVIKKSDLLSFINNDEAAKKIIYILEKMYVEGIVLDNRGSIIGIKKEGQRLRFYIDKKCNLHFPLIKEIVEYYNASYEYIDDLIKRTISITDQNKRWIYLKGNKEKSEQDKTKSLRNRSNQKSIEITKKIEVILKENDNAINKEVLFDKLCEYKQKEIYIAIYQSENLLTYNKCVYDIKGFNFSDEDLKFIDDTLNLYFDDDGILDFVKCFIRLSGLSSFAYNGINTKGFVFNLLKKMYSYKYYFSKPKYIISQCEIKNKKNNINNKTNVKKELGDELLELLDIEDLIYDV